MKKSWGLAVLSGLLFTLAWPSHGFPLLIFLAWIPLFILSDLYSDKKKRALFGRVYLTFFLFNLLVTYWIWFATPVGAVIAIFVNSLLMASVFLLWHWSRKRIPSKMYWPLFVVLWISFEKIHHTWDFEWPWLSMGNVFASWPWWVQWYAYTGMFGGSLYVLTANILLYRSLKKKRKSAWFKSLAFIFIPALISWIIFYTYEEKGEEVKVAVLQPNVDPWSEKFDRSNVEALEELLSLLPDTLKQPDLILAPETALPAGMEKDKGSFRFIQTEINAFLRRRNYKSMLTGATLYQFHYGKNIPLTAIPTRKKGVFYTLYNSALLFQPDTTYQLYNKSILVVGAEKMPYHRFLSPLLGDIVLDLGGASGTHTPSPEPVVFKVRNTEIRVAPIICYESVFGDYVRKYVEKGANLLAVITNDGWWRKTGGYRQHFDYARLRAIENRRDVVRSSNTGKSGHINQKGEVVQSLEFNKQGVLIVYPKLNNEKTFYTEHGDYIARVAIFLTLLLLLYAVFNKKFKVLLPA